MYFLKKIIENNNIEIFHTAETAVLSDYTKNQGSTVIMKVIKQAGVENDLFDIYLEEKSRFILEEKNSSLTK